MLRKHISENSGMTRLQFLILVVMVIVIGVLSFPPWLEYRKVGTADIDVETIAVAIKKYFRHTEHYPTSLDALMTDPGLEGWRGNYLESIPETPWGGSYVLLQDTYKVGIARTTPACQKSIASVVSRRSVESIMRTRVSVRSIGFLTIKYGQRSTPLHAGFCLSQGPALGYERLLILPENTAKPSSLSHLN